MDSQPDGRLPFTRYSRAVMAMTIAHEYRGEKFIVSKPEDCTMKVTKDGCTATISVQERSGEFRVDINDGQIAHASEREEDALQVACNRILKKLRASPKDELCSRLDGLYDNISKASA